MPISQNNGVNVEDLKARGKDFRKVQLICFFGILLPIFLVCSAVWLLSAMITCKNVLNQLSTSTFAEDVMSTSMTPGITRASDEDSLILSDLNFSIDNQVAAVLKFCGHSCNSSSCNTSTNLMYKIQDFLLDSGLYRRDVRLSSSSKIFQCDYIVSNIDLSDYLSHTLPASLSLTSGKASSVNVTISSVPIPISLTLETISSRLRIFNHSKNINISLLGNVLMSNINGDILVRNASQLSIINVSTSNLTAHTIHSAFIYWSYLQPVPILQSLTLLVAYNSTTFTGQYLICIPIEALIREDGTSVSMLFSNRGISESVTVYYYENRDVVSFSQASLTSLFCNSFYVQYNSATYYFKTTCRFGTIAIEISKDSQPRNSEGPTKIMTVHNNGPVDLHIYRASDRPPNTCITH